MIGWRAPGRVNLIGDHTDYNDGFCLPLAIDRECVVTGERRSDGRVLLRSHQLDGAVDLAAEMGASLAVLHVMAESALRTAVKEGWMAAGDDDETVERLGKTLMALESRMDELKETFELTDEDLNLDLGPLGRLL